MERFGFISPLLPKSSSWDFWSGLLPDKWRYRWGPLPTGPITGYLSGEKMEGFGWKAPGAAPEFWNEAGINKFWQRLVTDSIQKEIKIFGLDAGIEFHPPPNLLGQKPFPGVSDGKALELLLFLNYFRGILRNYGIAPQKAKAMVIWEEGNLGLACARLIAREIRFLTLVYPNARFLERAAGLITAETGVSPRIYTTPPEIRHDKIIIQCGRFSRYHRARNSKQAIWCAIFQNNPSLFSLNTDLPIKAMNIHHPIPLYPALGETMLRSFFNLPGFWYGSELQLERIIKLASIFKELGIHIAI
jgi:hypothetical protein